MIKKLLRAGSLIFVAISSLMHILSFTHRVDERKEDVMHKITACLTIAAFILTLGTIGLVIKEDRDIKRLESHL